MVGCLSQMLPNLSAAASKVAVSIV